MKPHPEVFVWFLGTWIALALISVLLHFSRDVKRKKRLLPVFTVSVGVLFSIFVLIMSGEPKTVLFVVPATALITFMNLRLIKVCESCGRTVYNNVWYSKMEFCSKCGAKLP